MERSSRPVCCVRAGEAPRAVLLSCDTDQITPCHWMTQLAIRILFPGSQVVVHKPESARPAASSPTDSKAGPPARSCGDEALWLIESTVERTWRRGSAAATGRRCGQTGALAQPHERGPAEAARVISGWSGPGISKPGDRRRCSAPLQAGRGPFLAELPPDAKEVEAKTQEPLRLELGIAAL